MATRDARRPRLSTTVEPVPTPAVPLEQFFDTLFHAAQRLEQASTLHTTPRAA